jgi:hypothetical protein
LKYKHPGRLCEATGVFFWLCCELDEQNGVSVAKETVAFFDGGIVNFHRQFVARKSAGQHQ